MRRIRTRGVRTGRRRSSSCGRGGRRNARRRALQRSRTTKQARWSRRRDRPSQARVQCCIRRTMLRPARQIPGPVAMFDDRQAAARHHAARDGDERPPGRAAGHLHTHLLDPFGWRCRAAGARHKLIDLRCIEGCRARGGRAGRCRAGAAYQLIAHGCTSLLVLIGEPIRGRRCGIRGAIQLRFLSPPRPIEEGQGSNREHG